MTLIQVIVLSLIQGVTEFLPISSSAHLILGGRVFGWAEQGLVFDVATHLGTLLAALVYFRQDLARMLSACIKGPTTVEESQNRRLAGLLALATVPALLVGCFAADFVAIQLRDVTVIAWATIVFGLLLWWADARFPAHRDITSVGWKAALAIGLAQVLALVPGTSRSGITITAGRFLGLDAQAAARFSFLLSIPVIAAAGAYGAWQVDAGLAGINWSQFALAVAVSAVTALACIAAFLALVGRIGLTPFVIYRLVLGVALLWLAR